MNKAVSLVMTGTLIIAVAIIVLGGSKQEPSTNTGQVLQNVEVRDGVQYITINAKGGYSPRISSAEANIPTKLVVKTEGTFDCSLALVIRSIGYQKILPQTGEEVIDLGTPKVGKLQGLCSMGMYSFAVDFK